MFFLLSMFFSLWVFSLYFGLIFASVNYSATFVFGRLTYGSSVFASAFIPFFFYYFPRKTFRLPSYILYPYVILSLLLGLVTFFTPLVQKGPIIEMGAWTADEFGPLQPLYVLYFILQILIGLILAIYKSFKTTGIERKKTIIAVTGLCLCYFPTVTVNAILPLYGIFVLQTEVVLFVLLFIIPTFYSILHYRFLEFTSQAFRVLRLLLLFTIFMVFSIVLSIFFETFIDSFKISHAISDVVAFLLVVYLADKFPEFTTKEFREFRDSLFEIKVLASYSNTYRELQTLLDQNIVQKLHIDSTMIYSIREEIIDIEIPQFLANSFTEDLKAFKEEPLILSELEYSSFSEAKKNYLASELETLSAELCFPLFAEGNIVGMWVIGPKINSIPFSKEEIDELKKVRSSIEVCFINILIKKNLQEEKNMMQQIIDGKTKELKLRIRDVKELVKQQSDFIAVTAHEFRTPLSIALFQVEDVLNSHEHIKDVQEDIKVVESALGNLKDLTQRLFDVQKYDLEKIDLELQETDLQEFVLEVYKDFKLQARGRGIQLSYLEGVNGPALCNIDRSQLRQVVFNLLSNAEKFVPPERGIIELSLEEDHQHFYIKVSDNGKGIKDEDKLEIFNKFQTKRSSVGKNRGIGLGLYICKKIIEFHGGQIYAEDNGYGGATIAIKLKR